MIGPAQRLISGVDTISQNFKEKQIGYHQWDTNALVETAIATALTALMVPPFYQLWRQSPVPLQKTSTRACSFPAEGRTRSLQSQDYTNPWQSPSSGSWNNAELFTSPKIRLPQKCKGRGTLPQASQGHAEKSMQSRTLWLACWVLSLLEWGSVGQKGILGKEGDSKECSTSCFLWNC